MKTVRNAMEFLELTLSSVEENLALDEALLRAADGGQLGEVLRIWESPRLAVVVGRASSLAGEVHVEQCREWDVPVLRRCSGGCAVVIGPGCLLYSLVLKAPRAAGDWSVDRLHATVLDKLAEALSKSGRTVVRAGMSDLAIADNSREISALGPTKLRKISGNSVRYGRHFVLYHGTLLYQFDLLWLERLLKNPPRQPEYRASRTHAEFVTNLPLSRQETIVRLRRAWKAEREIEQWPEEETKKLLLARYSQPSWHWER